MNTKHITCIKQFVERVEKTWAEWEKPHSVWFRGESHKPDGDKPSLRPKVFSFDEEQENYLLQSFRRKAGGMVDTPPFERTDLWLFLAQHHNVPTRLLGPGPCPDPWAYDRFEEDGSGRFAWHQRFRAAWGRAGYRGLGVQQHEQHRGTLRPRPQSSKARSTSGREMSGKALGDWLRRFQGKDVRKLQPCDCSPQGFVSSVRVLGIPEQLSRAGYDSWPKYGTLGFNKRPFLAVFDHTNEMDDSAQLV
ncbi:MAG: FRG domain-containing protein [Candidatus Hydrogenedentales bacterium]|jgi:hypothetical protein